MKVVVVTFTIMFCMLNYGIAYEYSKKTNLKIAPYTFGMLAVCVTLFFSTVLIKFLYNMGWWPE